jgi:hypothetical protein
LAGLGVVLSTDAEAAVTTPTNGSTIQGTVTVTESPGGSDTSSILGLKHCSGNTSTQLLLVNSAGTTVWSTSNSGGALSAAIRTESYPNGTYSVKGVENSGANSGFLGTSCKTNTANFANAVTISNQKALAYSGVSDAIAGRSAAVSAKVTDPNDGSAVLAGQAVTFALSGGTSVTATTGADGVATASLPVNTPPRSATLTVSSAATAYFTATSTTVPFTVDKIPSTVTVAPTQSVVHGQEVQFTATVGHDAGLAATGQVQFTVDGNDFGAPVALSGDVAQSDVTSSLSTGDHTVVARYSGDPNYLASTSDAVTEQVGKAPTTTTIGTSLNPAVFGQPVTFTAHVNVQSPGVGAPSGAVQFDVDGNPYGTAVPMSGDAATLTIPSLGGGNHTVTATYNGNTDFATSSSADLTQGVDLAGTKVVIHSSAEPAVTGQPVTFSVDVSAQPPGVGTPTGLVQFSVDGTDIGDPVALDNGSAIAPTFNDLAPGTHVVLANYQGSADFSGELGSFTEHVNPARTTTSTISSANPSVFGQPVTFTAAVAPVAPGSGDPGGSVQFSVDGVATGSPVALTDGTATSAPIGNLTTGVHEITAAYLGDTRFAGSESDAIDQTVNRAKTTTSLRSSENPSVFGQPVTLTASLSVTGPGAGNPTGTVTFTDGATTLGVVDVGPDTDEQASIASGALAVGPHAISATYSGDADFQSSADASTQTVHRAHTSTVVTASVNPAQSGQAVRFTAVISPVAPGDGVASGTVTFTVNGAPIGSPVTLAGGSATSAAFSSLSPGTYDIEATYGGDQNFVGSSAALDEGTGLDVTQAATAMGLTSSPNPSAYGATVSFTATVSAVAPATGRPSGVVDLYDGDALLGAASLSAGDTPGVATATITSSTLTSGSHAMRAVYLGNFNFTGQSASLSQVVGQVPTTTGLSVASNPVVYGQAVALTAVVASNPPAAGAPTGPVTFTDGATVLGTVALAAQQGSQVATLSVPGLEGGVHHLRASYSGSAGSAASTSVTVDETIQRAPSTLAARWVINAPLTTPQNAPVAGQVQATLTGNNGAPLGGQTLIVTAQRLSDETVGTICTVVTDAQGTASYNSSTIFQVFALDHGYDVSFAGSTDYLPVTIHKQFDDH